MAEQPRNRTEGDSAFWTWLLPVLSFLAGIVLATAVFVLGFGDDEDEDDPAAAPTPTSSPRSPAPPDEVVVSVPSSCVEAAEGAEAVTSALGDVANAARSLDARQLQSTLDVVQDLRPGVEEASRECLAIAAEAEIVTPSPSPSPAAGTPQPAPTAPATS